MIRELNGGIRALDEAEQLRRETETAIIRKKYASGLSALSSWASGGTPSDKSAEHAAAEARAQQVDMHRDGVLWFLRQRLELCCRTQQDMMETRLMREMEKTRGFLPPPATDFAVFAPPPAESRPSVVPKSGAADEATPWQGLTEEQVQMFEEGNRDMTKHYESTLDKVKYVSALVLDQGSAGQLADEDMAGPPRSLLSRFPSCRRSW